MTPPSRKDATTPTSAGGRHATSADDGLTALFRELERARATREELSRALWAMSPAERVAAMWRQELALSQLREWSTHAPHEVPRAGIVGGEYMWIAMLTPEWLGE